MKTQLLFLSALLGLLAVSSLYSGPAIRSGDEAVAGAIAPGNFPAGDWDFVTNSTVTVEGTGSQCFAADTPSLSVDCNLNRVGIGITNPSVTFEVVGGSIAVPAALDTPTQPTYTFTGDLNTGIFNSAADTLNFTTGGTERVRINSGGNVGIGVTAPLSLLHVAGTSAALNLNDTQADASGNATAIRFKSNAVAGDNRAKGAIYFVNDGVGNGTGNLRFATNNTQDSSNVSTALGRMEITAAGNVGIASSTPLGLLVVGSGATPPLTVLTGGNVGIGVSNPSVTFEVVGGSIAVPATGNAGGPQYTFTGDTNTGIFNSAADTLNFATGGTERVRIISDGNVGIGVTAPLSILHAAGTSATINVNDTQADASGNAAGLRFKSNSVAGDNRAKGAIYFVNDGAGNGTGNIRFATNNTQDSSNVTTSLGRMEITAAGNVGIGTTSPGALLDVRGGVLINSTDQQASTFTATGGFLAPLPDAQTIGAGNTVAADACGGTKLISSAGAVTTDTTNTFTAPAVANKGCIMHVCNSGANNITLDNNANFKSIAGADIVLTADDCTAVSSTGSVWYSVGPLVAN